MLTSFFLHPIDKSSVAAASSDVSYLFGLVNLSARFVVTSLFGWLLVLSVSLALLLAQFSIALVLNHCP